jgi:hypothetical protein
MKPEFPPETLTIYQLVRRNAESLYFTSAGTSPTQNSLGLGFYATRQEAEYNRTLEVLKCKTSDEFYIFELEIPNPIIK